jgi:hypothetical protein
MEAFSRSRRNRLRKGWDTSSSFASAVWFRSMVSNARAVDRKIAFCSAVNGRRSGRRFRVATARV